MLPAGGGGPVDFANAPVGVIDWWGLRTGGGGGFTVRATSADRDPEGSEPLIVTFNARHSALLRLRSDMLATNKKKEEKKTTRAGWKTVEKKVYLGRGKCRTVP